MALRLPVEPLRRPKSRRSDLADPASDGLHASMAPASGFGSPIVLESGLANLVGLQLANVTGSRRPDLVVETRHSVSVFPNDGSPQIFSAAAISVPTADPIVAATTADLTGNGASDVVLVVFDGARTLSTWTFALGGHRMFQPIGPPTVLSTTATGGSVTVTTGDFDHDGMVDIAVAYQSRNGAGAEAAVAVLYGKGDGTFRGPLATRVAGLEPIGLVAADFDSDGLLDLAVLHSASLQLLAHDPTHTEGYPHFSVSRQLTLGFRPRFLTGFDLNPGILPGVLVGTECGVVLALPVGSTGFTLGGVVVDGSGQRPEKPMCIPYGVRAAVAAPLVGDSARDLAVISDEGRLYMGSLTEDRLTAYDAGPNLTALLAADLNSDGRVDIVAIDHASGTIRVFLNGR
jgi:hypothetical protein